MIEYPGYETFKHTVPESFYQKYVRLLENQGEVILEWCLYFDLASFARETAPHWGETVGDGGWKGWMVRSHGEHGVTCVYDHVLLLFIPD